MNVTRSQILKMLTKARLILMARSLGLRICSSANRKDFIYELEKSRVFTNLDILQKLRRDELKALCRAVGCHAGNANKVTYIAQLMGNPAIALRASVIGSLKSQGFTIANGRITVPDGLDKDGIRRLHKCAMAHKRDRAHGALSHNESSLLSHIAEGHELQIASIQPKLVEVVRRSEEELLFRYACLHWAIPVSSGYGRRLRFLVVDANNQGKLIGVLGLGDPVFALQPRESWIGWDAAAKSARLKNVVDAFVLGAVPPYSQLLCGKLVAMLATSNEVRSAFMEKYGGKETLISRKTMDGHIALLTTTSALGRSSIYNRMSFQNAVLFRRVGYTRGYGDFQFLNGLYDELSAFAHSNCSATAKHELWGAGFRNRREVVKKSLQELGLSSDLLCHGVRREVFVVPMASNSQAFLCGHNSHLDYCDRPAADLWAHFRSRWLLPRASRDKRYLAFRREDYRLWPVHT